MNNAATKAYKKRVDDVLTALAEIEAAVKADVDDGPINWGHVGSMGHYLEQLQDVADALLRRNEYA